MSRSDGLSEFTEGQPMIYVPVCKDPSVFPFVFGPAGYVRVDKVDRCPLLIEGPAPNPKQERTDA